MRLETAAWPGENDRAPIVLLHEGLGSVEMWKAFPARLAARTGRRVVAYSRRGYGRSAPRAEPYAPAYMQREGAAVVPAVLAELGIVRAVLFGHSDGASIALVAAAEHPAIVAALVLEAPHVFVEDLSVRSIAAARDAWEQTDLRARLGRYHEDVDGAFRGWNEIWLSPAFRDWNIEAYAARVRAPMLVIQGEADEYGTRAQVESIAARAPLVQICMLAGAGHSPHRDDEAAVLERVAAFLDSADEPTNRTRSI